MSNFRKGQEPAPAIRLQKQAILPTAADLAEMANESRRAKKAIELLWHPEGRPDPVVLTIRPNEPPAKPSWILYNNPRGDAIVVWSADGAEAERVITALRDWYSYARATEGWCRDPNMPYPFVPNQATQPVVSAPPPLPAAPAPVPEPGHAYPSNQYSYPTNYPPAPYPPDPTLSGPAQVNAGWSGNIPYPQSSYPQYPYQVYGVPPHWSQYPQPPSQANPYGPQGQYQAPLSPEAWTARPMTPNSAQPLLLGDLLVASGLIPTQTLQAALTLQNTSLCSDARPRIGEILVNSGAIGKKILDAAIRLQELARQGYISPSRINDILTQVQATGRSPEEVLGFSIQRSESHLAGETVSAGGANPPDNLAKSKSDSLMESGRVSDDERLKLQQILSLIKELEGESAAGTTRGHTLLGLFKQSGIIKTADIEDIAKVGAGANVVDLLKSLLVKQLIDPITFKAGIDCLKLLSDDRLKREQAIIALLYSHRSRVTLRDAISDMNWLIPMEDLQS